MPQVTLTPRTFDGTGTVTLTFDTIDDRHVFLRNIGPLEKYANDLRAAAKNGSRRRKGPAARFVFKNHTFADQVERNAEAVKLMLGLAELTPDGLSARKRRQIIVVPLAGSLPRAVKKRARRRKEPLVL